LSFRASAATRNLLNHACMWQKFSHYRLRWP